MRLIIDERNRYVDNSLKKLRQVVNDSDARKRGVLSLTNFDCGGARVVELKVGDVEKVESNVEVSSVTALCAYDQQQNYIKTGRQKDLYKSKVCLKLPGEDSDLDFLATSVKNPDRSMKVNRPGALPGDWLPGGIKGPCLYRLDLTVDAEIEPLITTRLPGIKIPGLTSPIPFHLHEESNWENMGCDPLSGEFFVNK